MVFLNESKIIPVWRFSHIDGHPCFAKPSIDDSKQVKIAAIDPDF
jgi:hypothetical protein